MDDNQKYKSGYVAEDIRKYLEGRLSPVEMHLMEKAALEDPFLADAIEGIQLRKNFFAEDVDDLRNRINKKIGDKKRMPVFSWWKVAAVLVVLITGIAVSYNLVNNKNSDAVIVSEARAIPADTNKNTQKEALLSQSAGASIPPLAEPKTAVRKITRKHKTVEKNEEVPGLPVPVFQKSKTPAGNETDNNKKQEHEADTPAVPLQDPVPGIAAESKRFDSNVMDEVVVSGYGANEKFRSSSSSGNKRIVPKGGWESFHEYIERNKLRNISDTSIHGTQEIGFRINDEGRPENIKIEESISQEIDQAAIRLIMEGPSWEVLKGQKKKVRLKILY